MKLIYKIRIVDRLWRVYLWEPESYHNKFYKHYGIAYGLTHYHRRVIDLPVTADAEDIKHELWHAYSYELCLSSSPLKKAALDEIMCDFFAKYGSVYLKQCKSLVKRFRKVKSKYRKVSKKETK